MTRERRNATNLLPCPFCGSPATLHWSGDREIVNVRCAKWAPGRCLGAGANQWNEEAAITAWNTRTPSSAVAASGRDEAVRKAIAFLREAAKEIEDDRRGVRLSGLPRDYSPSSHGLREIADLIEKLFVVPSAIEATPELRKERREGAVEGMSLFLGTYEDYPNASVGERVRRALAEFDEIHRADSATK